jgi:hypothetical protein
MTTKTGVPELAISAYTSLEQAMAEVRTYLEAKNIYAAAQSDMVSFAAGQMSMQGAFVGRLTDIANRLDQVDPNSKLRGAGFFLKRTVRKLIGWYSRPSQEFDRTAVHAFSQIRQDMLLLQQQIATLQRKIETQSAKTASIPGAESVAGRTPDTQIEQVQMMLLLFRSTISSPAVRKALQQEKPELLQRVEELLNEVERHSSPPTSESS